jgi:hypothetical protein
VEENMVERQKRGMKVGEREDEETLVNAVQTAITRSKAEETKCDLDLQGVFLQCSWISIIFQQRQAIC